MIENNSNNDNLEGILLSETNSVCPVCLKRVEARYFAYSNGVFLEKSCREHGDYRVLVWDEPVSFLKWKTRIGQEEVLKGDCPNDCGICENHIQDTCCVLLELTQRCDLGCPVCFASSINGNAANDPDITQITGWYDMLKERGGQYNIQLSGGEPTMRDDLHEIIRIGRERGFTFFQLNTNGLRIAREDGYIEKLAAEGLSTVFLQFDGFAEKTNMFLRGRYLTEDKLRAVKRCREASVGVVLVPTIIRDVNDTEIGKIMNYAAENMPIIRGVHFQPISLFGRYSVNSDARITVPELLERIERQTEGKVKKKDFSPSNAEHPLCGFHADYTVTGGNWQFIKGSNEGCNCGISSAQARSAVARKWNAPDEIISVKENISNEAMSFDDFINLRQNTTLAISGMSFQDAYTMDLNRLRRCYIHIISQDGRLIPFCSYNLSSDSGKTLYRYKN